jgi:hypothetical protein
MGKGREAEKGKMARGIKSRVVKVVLVRRKL